MKTINKFILIVVIFLVANISNILYSQEMLQQLKYRIDDHDYYRLCRVLTQLKLERQIFAMQSSSVWERYLRIDGTTITRNLAVRVTTDPWWNRIIYSNYSNSIKSYGDNLGDIQFNNPHGICKSSFVLNPDVNLIVFILYVADTGNNRIVELQHIILYNPINGEIMANQIGFSREFSNLGLSSPYDVAYDDSGTPDEIEDDFLWVTDVGNHRIVEINLQSGEIENIFGTYGSDENEFNYPHYLVVQKNYQQYLDGITVQDGDHIYVVDNGNHRLIDLSKSSGEILWERTFNYTDSSWNIAGISSDAFGNIWATDRLNSKIHRFNKRLKYIGNYGTHGPGFSPGYLYYPVDVDNLFRTFNWNGNFLTEAPDALFATETWSDGSGQIRYKVIPICTKMKWYTIYIFDGNVYIEPPNSPEKRKISHERVGTYHGNTFYFSISDHCKMDAKIKDVHEGTIIKNLYASSFITAGDQYIFWDGKDDSGEEYYSPGTPLKLLLRFKSLYDPSVVTTFEQDFQQGSSSSKNSSPNEIEDTNNVIKEFAVFPNYPNPFNNTTRIKYQIPQKGKVELVIYNVLGQKVQTLVDAAQEAGEYTTQWDGQNDSGNEVGSGVYIYRLLYKTYDQHKEEVKKLLLLK